MDTSLYDAFRKSLDAGLKKNAKQQVKQFLASFRSESEREAWTREFLETHTYGEKVRYEIFADVIFPVLMAGRKSNDAWANYWLAGTVQNLYSTPALWKKADYYTEVGFLTDAYQASSDDKAIRAAYCKALLAGFGYAMHEWPAGILYGNRGATLDECQWFKERIALGRSLAIKDTDFAFLDKFESVLSEYVDRLKK